MLDKLKAKWKVSLPRLIIILCTFAIGGSLAGLLAKKVINQMALEQDWLYGPLYIIVVTLIWPLSVITVSVPLGQFSFFSRYLRNMAVKLGLKKKAEVN